jgi:hypothetical protein
MPDRHDDLDIDGSTVNLHDDLSGQVLLVTGATRGIGAEVASQLHALGATVYAGARDPTSVAPGTDRLRPVELDVTDPGQIDAAVDLIDEETGRLDALVNNAGVYGPAGRLGEVDPETAVGTLRTNLEGPLRLTHAALPLLTRAADSDDGGEDDDRRSAPRVVNVSSGAGQFAGGVSGTRLPYAVSKAGLNALTQGLAASYPDLLANAVCPGWVRTDMGGSNAPRTVAEGADTVVWLVRFTRGSPAGLFWRDRSVIEW